MTNSLVEKNKIWEKEENFATVIQVEANFSLFYLKTAPIFVEQQKMRSPDKKKKKTKTKTRHPSYLNMIKEAVENLCQRNGSSLVAITKYLSTNYSLPEGFKARLKTTLKKGVEDCIFTKIRNSYKLSKKRTTTSSSSSRRASQSKSPLSVRRNKRRTVNSLDVPNPTNAMDSLCSPRDSYPTTESDEEIIQHRKKNVKRKLVFDETPSN